MKTKVDNQKSLEFVKNTEQIISNGYEQLPKAKITG